MTPEIKPFKWLTKELFLDFFRIFNILQGTIAFLAAHCLSQIICTEVSLCSSLWVTWFLIIIICHGESLPKSSSMCSLLILKSTFLTGSTWNYKFHLVCACMRICTCMESLKFYAYCSFICIYIFWKITNSSTYIWNGNVAIFLAAWNCGRLMNFLFVFCLWQPDAWLVLFCFQFSTVYSRMPTVSSVILNP